MYSLISHKNYLTFLKSSDSVFDVHDTSQVNFDCSIPLYKFVYIKQSYILSLRIWLLVCYIQKVRFHCLLPTLKVHILKMKSQC